jgi:hypothetical protein
VVLVDGAPQVIPSVANRHEDFIKAPAPTLSCALSPKTPRVFGPEFQTPSTNGSVRDNDGVLGQQFFNIAQTQREPYAEAHCVRNDLGQKVETAIE